MKCKYYEVHKLPVVICEDYYTEQELASIHTELALLQDKNSFTTPELTGSDIRTTGSETVFKRQNLCVQLDSYYKDRRLSDILTHNRKIFNETLLSELIKKHKFFDYLRTSNKDITKVHYYQDGDHYEYHQDIAVITCMTWLYNQPKQFEGGELLIENLMAIKPDYNRTIIMPSILQHQVEPVSNKTATNKHPGRYTITQFIGFQ